MLPSLPTRERGLKQAIEGMKQGVIRRFPRGSVD